MPAFFALSTVSLSDAESIHTITITSTPFFIKYSICSFCFSTSPFAFCTLTLAPSSLAVDTNTSLSLCHLSITNESKLMAISILFSSLLSLVSASFSFAAQAGKRKSIKRHRRNNFFFIYLPSLYSVGVTPTFFLKDLLK